MQADENYQHLEYIDAQKVYLTVAEKGFESEELFTKLGNTFYFNAQYDEAAKWYGRIFDLGEEPKNNIVLLRYSQALQAIGQDELAGQFYDSYLTKTGTEKSSKRAIDYLELIEQNSGRYDIKVLEKIYDENKISFGKTILGNNLVYASTQTTQTFENKRSAWDGLSFLSLYEVEINQENEVVGKPSKLKGILKSDYHDSSPVFTADGNTIYFTRSNITSARKNDRNLKIYRSKKVDGKWSKAEELNFNSDLYSSAHPALNADETKLYFSSDRPGGFGESDLYVAQITPEGLIGAPENLGPKVNTSGKETFPFVTDKNELYFSSDGHFGLGGMDVFYIKMNDKEFGNLLNVGAPVNSYADDFAFGIDERTKRGFISSNRTDSTGVFVYDNIYSFIEKTPIVDLYFANIEGYVTDKQTGKPIENATITFKDPDNNLYITLQTDINGYYSTETNKFLVYSIRAEKEDYDTDEKISESNLEHQRIDFQLQKNKEPIIPGTDLAKVLNIPIIHFDFDKSNIRPDAQIEIEKVLAVLNEYPKMRLAIRSHTDSRGSDSYNQALSERRAKSTLEYLVNKGVNRSRLTATGLGESELVNRCSDGVPCSEQEHQQNRRSEFIVLD
ncbi:OmpA family protein [Aequorivita ciconiae]|uniref:OmpA family protein n=1 Tax=Aequorivita ciconiae TaxID=2494375 RepID=UPI001F0BA596|nr:OmpA family protein [Aequorivita sp. H23M31]